MIGWWQDHIISNTELNLTSNIYSIVLCYELSVAEGLQENPLYITSGESSNADIGPVYGVVNKQKQNKKNIAAEEIIDTGPVYSLVQKSKTQGI